MNREDFPILEQNIIYFDNSATALKPKVLCEAINDYYMNYSANAHRGDYDISLKVDQMYEGTRQLIKDFIGANSVKEIVFTSGATDSLNKIIFGFFKHYLKEGDEILLTKAEHASNLLPWYELAEEKKLNINYIDLDSNYSLTLDSLKSKITNKTKVISLAYITNVVGDVRPIKEIVKLAHSLGIIVVVDGAQSVPHLKMDVKELDCDFLVFSAHKMCGPTGLGIIYGKEKYLNNTRPIIFGGGMNASFDEEGVRVYKEIPHILEPGTPNIADVIAFGSVLKYLNGIGIEKINSYEKELKRYAIDKLKTVKDIIIYNENTESGIVTFNIKDVFAQDLAIYLNKYNICVRAGNHCAKILKNELKIKNTCRASFYFYNTKDEIDKLAEVLSNPNLKNEII